MKHKKTCFQSRGYSGVLTIAFASVLLSGCGAYYVSAANDFSTTAATLGPVVQQADANQLKAENDLKLSQISRDASCRVAGSTIYVRRISVATPGATVNFLSGHPGVESVLKSVSGGALPPSCQALKACESNGETDACRSICYGEREIPCLNQIAVLSLNRTDVAWNPADLTYVVSALQKTRYPETQTVKSKALTDALHGFTSYLDLLKTAATPEPTRFNKVFNSAGYDLNQSIKDDASDIAKKIESARSGYNQAAKYAGGLPQINGVSDANLTKELGAFGALADTLNSIAQTNGSASEIKAVVEQRKADLNQQIRIIGTGLADQATRSFVQEGISNITIRQAYQQKFSSAPNQADRQAIVREMSNYPAPDQAHAISTLLGDDINKVTQNIIDAHDTLIRMLDNPNRADEKKKMEAGLKNIKDLVVEITAIVAIYK